MTSLPKPLNARGASSVRWQRWRTHERGLVAIRCRGRCEVAHCKSEAQEAHHVFGRGRTVVAEPLASWHGFLAGLCKDHHREVTREPAHFLAQTLKAAAIGRALRWFHLAANASTLADPNGAARAIESELRESGEWERLREQAGVT